MLRINLLPPSVTQRRLSAKLIQGFAALLTAIVLILFAFYTLEVKQERDWAHKAHDAQAGKATTDGYKQKAQQISSKIAPLKADVDFAHQVHDYNIQQAQLYRNLADYTDPDVTYMGAAYAGNTMLIDAYAPSVGVLGRYLLRMYQEPDFSQVAINYVPDFKEAHLYATFYDGRLISISDNPRGSFISNLGGYPSTISFQGSRISLSGDVKSAPNPSVSNPAAGSLAGPASGPVPGVSGTPGAPPTSFPGAPGGFPGGAGLAGGANIAGAAKNNGTFPGVAIIPGPAGSPVPQKAYPTITVDEFGKAVITQDDAGSPQARRPFGGADLPKDGVPNKLPVYSVGRVIGSNFNPLAPPDAFREGLQQSLRHWRVKRINRGFIFQVTATLKQPLTPPKAPGT